MAVYFFTGAAVFSIIPFVYLVKINMEKVQKDPQNFNEIQKKFFISVTVSKILPALLLILGIIQMQNVRIEQVIIPWVIILIALVYGIYYILSFRRLPLTGAPKEAVNTLATLALPFIFSIPLMAAVFLFLMIM